MPAEPHLYPAQHLPSLLSMPDTVLRRRARARTMTADIAALTAHDLIRRSRRP